MKGKHFLCLVSLMLMLLVTSSDLLADISMVKSSTASTNLPSVIYSWAASKYMYPAESGTVITEVLSESYPATGMSCNNKLFTGVFTSDPVISYGTADVVERRYTNSGTVSGYLTGTITYSRVEYTITNGPDQCVGITVGRAEWELNGYTGTSYYYYRQSTYQNPFFGAHIDGDIHAAVHYGGVDTNNNLISAVTMTSMFGSMNTNSFTITWNNPGLYVEESTVTHTGIEIRYGTSTLSQTSLAGCYPAGTSDSVGYFFYLPTLNVGNFNGITTASGYAGVAQNYQYHITPGTDVVPRVIGLTKAGAEDIIYSKGFKIGSITYETSSVYPVGRVIRQSIQAGTLTSNNTVINLVVSTGTTAACECDLNKDGRCNMIDWTLFGRNWGRTNCPRL